MISGRALAFVAQGRVELVDIVVPTPGPAEVVVETEITAVSQGTDRAMVAGTYRGVEDRYPFIYGYSQIGTVREVGSEVTGVAPGDRVFVGMAGTRLDPASGFGEQGGAYTSHSVVHVDDVVRLPDDIGSSSAAVAALGAIAYQGVAASGVRPSSRVLVVGLGAIGQFSALLSGLRGAQVWVCDPVSSRRDLAQRLCGAIPLDLDGNLAARIEETAWGWRPWPGRNDPPSSRYEQGRWAAARGVVDVVIDATGRADAFAAYVPLLTREGHLCLQGYYAAPLTLDFHAAHLKRLTVHCPGGMDLQDYQSVLRLLRMIDVTPLIGAEIDVDQLPGAYQNLLRSGPSEVVSALIRWQKGGVDS